MNADKLYTEAELRELLRGIVAEAGSQRKAAESLGVSGQHINDVLHGNRGIGPRLAKAMGFQKRDGWVKVRTGQ